MGQATGRQFITALVSTYVLVFLTDIFGVAAGAAGAIMTAATIWDAVNDPIMGTLADRTRTKWGTYRPYLLFVPLPLSIVSVLLFAAPELSASGKIVYTAVLYICYGMLVTAIEIPFNAILPAMSKNEMERNDVISLSTFIASIMILIVSSFWCVGCILFGCTMSSSIYYCMYYLMNPALISTYMLVISVSGMAGVMVLMPIILRALKGSMKKAVTFTQTICVICFPILFFFGGKSITLLYVLTAVTSVFSTMTNAFRPMTVVGMTEYVFQSTGQQMNGTISAIGGFAYKCGTAVCNTLLAGVLAATGYIAGAIGEQPQAVLTGINAVRFLVPCLACVLYIILIQFYPEKKMGKGAQ